MCAFWKLDNRTSISQYMQKGSNNINVECMAASYTDYHHMYREQAINRRTELLKDPTITNSGGNLILKKLKTGITVY